MEAYTDFAYLYDIFMEDVPYEAWAQLIMSLMNTYGEGIHKVVDLGCGTGVITRMLAKAGYEMIGIDLSSDMLSVAASSGDEDDNSILYINQNMSAFELGENADAFISVCDSINYLIMDDDILGCLKSVKNYLNKDGLFIFDFNTIYKYETVIGDTTIAENREECSFIWENFYSTEDHINEYDITFFTKVSDVPENINDPDEGLFRRFSEVHIQRGYDLEEIKHFLQEAGLRFITAIDENTHKTPTEESERIYVVARG